MGAVIIALVAGGLLAGAYYLRRKAAGIPPAGLPPGEAETVQGKFGSTSGWRAPVLAKGTGETAAPVGVAPDIRPQFPGLDIQSMFVNTPPPPPPAPVGTSGAGPSDAPVVGTDSAIEDGIARFAYAIAHAEGFGVPDALPTRAHNPGDLKLGDRGNGTIQGKTVFASDADGWLALKAQIRLMWLDRSDYYGPDDTFQEIAVTWTGGDNWQAWLSIVSRDLGVTAQTTLRGYLRPSSPPEFFVAP